MRLLILLIFLQSFTFAQRSPNRNDQVELFSVWTSGSYMHEGAQLGFNLKLTYQIEPFLLLGSQGYYHHPNNDLELTYTEVRNISGFYIIPSPKTAFTPFLFIGTSMGYWSREYEVQFPGSSADEIEEIHNTYYYDQSYALGGGFMYNIGNHRIIAEHYYLPEIYQNITNIGMQFRIFKNDQPRKRRRPIKR